MLTPADTPTRAAAHPLHQVVCSLQQLAAFLHQHLSGRRQLRLAAATHHQFCLQPGFQLLDVQAHGGWRQVQRLGGRRKGAQVGNGNQGLQLVEVQVAHGRYISIYELNCQLIQLYRCLAQREHAAP